ncbi:hypothetical protein IT895_01965 [Halomonas sp. A40-4]|uniref:hypothetical protein n=1 Tax=Halomonas sp. A40-4 TaxID=2785909 RepID=UPI0018EF6125|nr:hypothetical protein [Halomonas sp. A40-4]QPL46606.1 hypothetical protein IT895_01965 [Halomonas sp. A40-4]
MIKKAVLPLLLAPFLMVFSLHAFAGKTYYLTSASKHSSPAGACSAYDFSDSISFGYVSSDGPGGFICMGRVQTSPNGYINNANLKEGSISTCSSDEDWCNNDDQYNSFVLSNPNALPKVDDEKCQSSNGSTIRVSSGAANALNAGGSFKTHGGACSVSSTGGVEACDASGECIVSVESISTDEYGTWSQDSSLNGAWPGGDSEGTYSEIDLNVPDYLTPLGESSCTDNSSCVTIGDTDYMVDWDSAPDYFEYVGSDGNTYSNPNSGGGSGGGDGNDSGDTGGSDPTDPDNPGDDGGSGSGGDDGGSNDDDDNDNGGGSDGGSGGGSDGGSSVPDFEFDESGIIEAVGSAGQANQSAIDAMSGDITGAINGQTDTLSDIIDGAADGLLEGITDALDGFVDDLADTFTEDLGSGDDLFDSSGMDETLDGVSQEEAEYGDEVRGLMGQIGEDESSSIAEQVTSRLPSLPSGSCTPMQFGPMEISCRAFTTIQQWLTWIVYFWTVVSVVDTFFRSSQRTA